MPKLLPPESLSAQNNSGRLSSFTLSNSPFALTRSRDRMLWASHPCDRACSPIPPPRLIRRRQRRHARLHPEGLLAEQLLAATQTHEPIAATFQICSGIGLVGVELSAASQSIGL